MENDYSNLLACRGCSVPFICFQDLAGRYSSTKSPLTKSPLSTTRTPSCLDKWNSTAWEVPAWL